MRKFLVAALCAVSFVANAQSVRQSGNVTPGHVSVWVAPGVIADGGLPGAAIITGASTVNDFVCIGMSGTLIDCGLSATATNNWSGLQNFNGGATALTPTPGDNSINVATTAFVQNAIGPLPTNSVTNTQLAQGPAYTVKGNNTAVLANEVDMTVSQFKTMAGVVLNIKDPAYGAKCDGSTDDAAAITSAIAALSPGGILLVDTTNCKVGSSFILNKPMIFQCGGGQQNVAGNINAGANNVSPLVINSHNVTIDSCYINGPGTPSGNTGIAIGTDSTTVTDGTCTDSSTIFTSASQASFTSADVGKHINATNCGTSGTSPLFTTIAGFTNSTTVTLGTTATCGGSCPAAGMATAKYGVVYLNTVIRNTKVINFNKGVHLIDASQTRLDAFYTQDNIGLHIEDQLNPDLGNTYISNSYILAIGTSAGRYGVLWNSGGEVFFSNTKILNGQYGIYHNSTLGLTGGFNFVGGGIENCGTTGAFFSEAAQFNEVSFSSTYINCGAPNFSFDNSSASIVNGAALTGVSFGGGGGTAIDAGKVNYLTATGNMINTSGGNPAINIRSNCISCLVAANKIVGASSNYANASSTSVVSQQDKNPTTQTFTSGSGTYTTPANVTWIDVFMVGGGGGGAGSATSPGAAVAGGGTCWNTTGAACTSPVYEAGGGALGPVNGSVAAGGTISGSATCYQALVGGGSGAGSGANTGGGDGGISTLGGAGKGGALGGGAGTNAAVNSGSGGGGGATAATVNSGSGGGAGATCRFIISAPAATYTYVVGAAGTAGTAGSGGGGQNGGTGGLGLITVIEHYN